MIDGESFRANTPRRRNFRRYGKLEINSRSVRRVWIEFFHLEFGFSFPAVIIRLDKFIESVAENVNVNDWAFYVRRYMGRKIVNKDVLWHTKLSHKRRILQPLSQGLHNENLNKIVKRTLTNVTSIESLSWSRKATEDKIELRKFNRRLNRARIHSKSFTSARNEEL